MQQVGGKEEDSEWGSQMIQDYGFRIYNPTIGKFLSVDPLGPEYPWYTPYQFAGNKVIWAIDIDGLEELIYQYTISDDKKVTLLKVISNRQAIEEYVDGPRGTNKIRTVVNRRTGKPFTKEHAGKVQYQYYDANGDRLKIRRNRDGKFVEGDNELMDDATDNYFSSIYIGPNNPTITIIGENGVEKTFDDYRREPQDEVDAAAKQHDQNYGKVGAAGIDGATKNPKAAPADAVLVINSTITILKYKSKKTDDITGERITTDTYLRASAVDKLFRLILKTTKRNANPELSESEKPDTKIDFSDNKENFEDEK